MIDVFPPFPDSPADQEMRLVGSVHAGGEGDAHLIERFPGSDELPLQELDVVGLKVHLRLVSRLGDVEDSDLANIEGEMNFLARQKKLETFHRGALEHKV